MTDNQQILEKNEIGVLSNELTYRHYLMNKGKVRELFRKMSMPEYLALHIIAVESKASGVYSGRTYLKDLSEKMELTIRQTSKMIGDLRDRGLILWAHDGDGSEGTYVTITETGENLLSEQETLLKEYYGKVISKFGKQNLIELLRLMKQLETVMSSELEEMEEVQMNDGIDE
ncbi:MAG: MarR family transcriptional regulator [Lachnospiraceae bacterium]|nr:MarR family transcriptional regulator [Lachnospiraceae bacterium]